MVNIITNRPIECNNKNFLSHSNPRFKYISTALKHNNLSTVQDENSLNIFGKTAVALPLYQKISSGKSTLQFIHAKISTRMKFKILFCIKNKGPLPVPQNGVKF